MPGRRRTPGHLVALMTTLVFLAAICVPAAAGLMRFNPHVPLQESDVNPMPQLRPDTVGHIIYMLRRNWLDRNFGLRKVLVRWEQLLDVRVLRASMPSDPVLAGKDEWLYLAQENPQLNVINDYRVVRPLTPEQLDIWAKVYTARRDWCREHGIRYMVLVAPNKATIYPEYIPTRFNRIRERGKLDQMVDTLQAAGVDILDLRPSLLEAKRQRLSYYRTDSHWTPYGAFQAYRRFVQGLAAHFPGIEPMGLEDFTVSEKPGLLGGLSYMIAMGDLYPENVTVMEPKKPRSWTEIGGQAEQINHFQPLSVYENTDKSLPRAFFFRDSFLHEMIPFMGEHFSRMYLQWPYPTDAVKVRAFDTAAILAEKPDIVVDQFVERYFTQPPPPSALSSLPGMP